MNYIPQPPPEHDDDEILFEDRGDGQPYTWGEHRAMEAMLAELEESNPEVKAAREKLDAKMVEYGLKHPPVMVCSGCGQPEFKPHDEECEYRPARPEEIPVRDAHGYEYYTAKFEPLHMTSVPCNDEEALDYFRIVAAMQFSEEVRVVYVFKRAWGENEYKMMPYQYFQETGEIIELKKDS